MVKHFGGRPAGQLHRPLHARWASRMVCLLLLATVSAVCSPFYGTEVDVLSMDRPRALKAACHNPALVQLKLQASACMAQ